MSNQKYKLAVASIVEFSFSLNLVGEDGILKTYEINLQAKRKPIQDCVLAIDEAIKGFREACADLMREVVCGWRDQQLVLDENGEPAAFTADAWECMLGIPSVDVLAYREYRKAMEPKVGGAKN